MQFIKPLISVARSHIKPKSGLFFTTFRPSNHLRCRTLFTTNKLYSDTNNNENNKENDTILVTFHKPDGKKVTVKASENKSLYDVVIDNNLDLDGFGACEGTLCCTTCHLIFNEQDYKKVGEPSDEELDMLDLAYGLTETSRLGCQIILKREFNPLQVQVPASINDVREA